MSRTELHAHLPTQCYFFFDSGLSYMGLVQAVTITVSYYVQFPCGIQRILFPYLHLLPLALSVFLSTLLP